MVKYTETFRSQNGEKELSTHFLMCHNQRDATKKLAACAPIA